MYRFQFTVSHEYSLDQLKKDLEPLYHGESTHVSFEIRGPAGGNTEVHVDAGSQSDFEALYHFAVDNGLTKKPTLIDLIKAVLRLEPSECVRGWRDSEYFGIELVLPADLYKARFALSQEDENHFDLFESSFISALAQGKGYDFAALFGVTFPDH